MRQRSTPQAVAGRSPDPLLERERELPELRGLLDPAARGAGRAAVVEGPGDRQEPAAEALGEDA